MIVAKALSATQPESQQPKVSALSSSARCRSNLCGTQGHIKPCIVLQGTSGGLLTVLSNSSDFLPYAVVISALLAL